MSAYDFFADCALQCLYTKTGVAANCEIRSTDIDNIMNESDCDQEEMERVGETCARPQIFSCSELGKITNYLEQKRNVLIDAIHLYMKDGKLTPDARQLINKGSSGCTQTMHSMSKCTIYGVNFVYTQFPMYNIHLFRVQTIFLTLF